MYRVRGYTRHGREPLGAANQFILTGLIRITPSSGGDLARLGTDASTRLHDNHCAARNRIGSATEGAERRCRLIELNRLGLLQLVA
jgi:hypothetical protein